MAHRGRAKAPSPRAAPELLATKIHQVWTWDISYLRGPIRGTFFYLSLMVGIFTRRFTRFGGLHFVKVLA